VIFARNADPQETSAWVLHAEIYNTVFLFSNLPANTIVQPQPRPDILKVLKTAPLEKSSAELPLCHGFIGRQINEVSYSLSKL
jgi:hypothetical protein